MFRWSKFIKMAFVFTVLLCLGISALGTVSAQDKVPEKADDEFWAFLGELDKNGIISLGGSATYYGDYRDEWAQIGWYQWKTFEKANRFVFSSKLSWDSASQTPNSFESGCGVLFNLTDVDNHLMASMRMDGMIYFTGKRGGSYLSYGTYKFSPPAIKKTIDFKLVVDNDKASIYIDGQRVVRKANMQVMGSDVALSTLSGTNKDFGTRCEWKDIFFYTW